MRIALIGGGTIARLVLEHVRRARAWDALKSWRYWAAPGAPPRARELAREFSVKYVETGTRLQRKNHRR
jgi:hypothetical protein